MVNFADWYRDNMEYEPETVGYVNRLEPSGMQNVGRLGLDASSIARSPDYRPVVQYKANFPWMRALGAALGAGGNKMYDKYQELQDSWDRINAADQLSSHSRLTAREALNLLRAQRIFEDSPTGQTPANTTIPTRPVSRNITEY